MKLLNSVKKLAKQIRAFFPSRLPVGMQEFDTWSDSFSEIYNLPTDNKDSIKFTLASIIMHLGGQDAYKSKFYFLLTVRSGAAKQIAGSVFYDIKKKAQEAEKAANDAAKQTA